MWFFILGIAALAVMLIAWSRIGRVSLRPSVYTQYVTSDQLKGLGVVVVATFVVVQLFGYLFPETAEVYYTRGGPWYSLIVGTAAMYLVVMFATGSTMRGWLIGSISIVLMFAVITALLPAIFVGKPSSASRDVAAAPPPVQQVVQRVVLPHGISTNCPGNPEMVELDETPIVINPGGKCQVKSRQEGVVRFIDWFGRTNDIGPVGGRFDDFWPVSARALKGKAVLRYMLVTP